MSKTEQIVYRLLEMDDPKKFIMRTARPPVNPETVQFRREAVLFLRYLIQNAADEIDTNQARADVETIKKSDDFDAIRTIVANYETGDFTFMDFVNMLR